MSSRRLVTRRVEGLPAEYLFPDTQQDAGVLVSVVARLTTSAVVANRNPELTLLNKSGDTVAIFPSEVVQAENSAVTYTWGGSESEYVGSGLSQRTVAIPMSAQNVEGGDTLRISMDLQDVDDTIEDYLIVVLGGPGRV